MLAAKKLYRTVAQRALGKPLPAGAEVHHVDRDRTNNSPSNLVICQDHAYHMLLHARQRVLDAGGDPNTQRICGTCKQLKVADELSTGRLDTQRNQCKSCHNAATQARKFKARGGPAHRQDPIVIAALRAQLAQNSRRTHCKNGHSLDVPDVIVSFGRYKGERVPRRQCRICTNAYMAKLRARLKSRGLAPAPTTGEKS